MFPAVLIARLFRSSELFGPQQTGRISFRRLRHRLYEGRFLSHAFEETSATGKRQPAEEPLERLSRNKKGSHSRDPD